MKFAIANFAYRVLVVQPLAVLGQIQQTTANDFFFFLSFTENLALMSHAAVRRQFALKCQALFSGKIWKKKVQSVIC